MIIPAFFCLKFAGMMIFYQSVIKHDSTPPAGELTSLYTIDNGEYLKVIIYGAGSTGCYIGALLHTQGIAVCLLGRDRIRQTIEAAGGITLSDYEGRQQAVKNVPFSCAPEVLKDATVVLVTLKCTALDSAIAELRENCPKTAIIVCLQNGLGAADKVSAALPEYRVLSGIIPFNVVQNAAGFHRSTQGCLHLPLHSALLPLQSACQEYGLGCELNDNIGGIVRGKLLLNLNNAINALSGLPLKSQLSQRPYRLVLAACQREWLRVCQAQRLDLARLTALPSRWVPTVLSLPDWAFSRVAQKMLAIDPTARSSMWEDLQHGRTTEVAWLNGAVVAGAKKAGLTAPVNAMICQWINEYERSGRIPAVSGEQLVNRMASLNLEKAGFNE